MSLTSLFGLNYEDTYNFPIIGDKTISGLAVLTCKNKKSRVSGFLTDGIHITGQAQWEEMFGGGIMSTAGSFIDTVNQIDQLAVGKTIQQPWMNRKFYKSTKPFSIDFTMTFVAESDANEEVYKPCQTLLSYVFPRQSENGTALEDLHKSGKLTDTKARKDADETQDGYTGSIVGNVLNSMSNYYIPGPSINYGAVHNKDNEDHSIEGDAVTLTIGSMFAFGGVYLESVDVTFSPSYDKNGFPLAAKVGIKATCMDVNYTDSNGNFAISQFADGNITGLADIIDSCKQTIEHTAANLKKIMDSWIGFFTGGSK